MYVTLEPCCHVGPSTPPCVEALAEAGVKRVFIGMQDPNPCVSGNGMVCLTDTNIEFAVGILEDECRTLNERFIKHITTGLPFVLLKGAMTLDGVIATKTGDSKWITSEASRRYAHSLRAGVDAVLVGVGTVLADDPSLTVRMVRPKKGQPLRVVLDSDLRTPENAKLVADGAAEDGDLHDLAGAGRQAQGAGRAARRVGRPASQPGRARLARDGAALAGPPVGAERSRRGRRAGPRLVFWPRARSTGSRSSTHR